MSTGFRVVDLDEDVWVCKSCNWIGPESSLGFSSGSSAYWSLCPKCSSALVELYLDGDKQSILENFYINKVGKSRLTYKVA